LASLDPKRELDSEGNNFVTPSVNFDHNFFTARAESRKIFLGTMPRSYHFTSQVAYEKG
jgi:hypothetical protein